MKTKNYLTLAVVFIISLVAATEAQAQITNERLGKVLLREHYESVTQDYGPAGHAGIDYRARNPLPVYAPVSGTVSASDLTNGHFAIRTSNGYHFIFLHLSGIYKNVGDTVRVGDLIGLTGETLYNDYPISGAHLHVEVRNGRSNPADPNSASSYQYNVNPINIVEEPERVQLSYALAPLVSNADIHYDSNGVLKIHVGISTYAFTADTSVILNVYDGTTKIWSRSYDNNSPEVSTEDASGYVSVNEVRIKQQLIVINGEATNSNNQLSSGGSVSYSDVSSTLSARVFVKNKTICQNFGNSNLGCRYFSAFIANIGGDSLGAVNSLKSNDFRRIWINTTQ